MHTPDTPLPGAVAPLPGIDAALIGLAALAVVAVPLLWPMAAQLSVMAHEGAHVVVGSAMGFTVEGVTLDQNAGGATTWGEDTPDGGPRRTVTRFAGYLGPSGFGLCAAKLIETGRVVTVLWLAILVLVLLLFLIRKSFGLLSVPAAVALLAVVTSHARSGVEEFFVYGMTWLLLLSGLRVAVARGAGSWDAAHLSRTTRVPAGIWALLWLAGTLLAVVIGGKWMVLRS